VTNENEKTLLTRRPTVGHSQAGYLPVIFHVDAAMILSTFFKLVFPRLIVACPPM
jgi:hypothetical protein